MELDPDAKLAEYAHPERLVTTGWLAGRLGSPGLVVLESDEDVLLHDTGHLPGAVKIDWFTELNDPVSRDYLDSAAFAALMSAKGVTRDDTVVLYGDKNNWWAAYALWVFELFGHPDVRLLDGGRAAWIAEGRELTTEIPERPVRADLSAGLHPRPQLRRLLDRVGQRGARADRHRRRTGRAAARGAGPMSERAVSDGLPERLGEIVDDFRTMPERQRLELLLEFSRELPFLPERLAADRDSMEPVVECQSPLFLLVELDSPGHPGSPVRLHFDALAEAPTTRGFASILFAGLDGLTAQEVVAVPDDVPQRLGLAKAVSPLRLVGMAGMLSRIKRQVRVKAGSATGRPGASPNTDGALPA